MLIIFGHQVEGEECMTPKDFLDSVIQDRPRPRIKRRILSSEDVSRSKNAYRFDELCLQL